jgi:hypothetical protein
MQKLTTKLVFSALLLLAFVAVAGVNVNSQKTLTFGIATAFATDPGGDGAGGSDGAGADGSGDGAGSSGSDGCGCGGADIGGGVGPGDIGGFDGGGSIDRQFTYTTPAVVHPRPTAYINGNPNSIISGNSSVLNWSSTNANACTVTGGGQTYYGIYGSVHVYPIVSTTYTIICTGTGGTATSYATINVQLRNYCTNGYSNYPTCGPTTCTNGTTNFPSCNVCPVNYVFTNGSCVYQQPTCSNGATNYPQCNNNICTNGATNYPYCNNNVVNPTANINANPNSVVFGSQSLLTWSSTNSAYCRLNGGSFNNQNVATYGTQYVYPTVNTNYTITCFNSNGVSVTDSTYVNVTQNNYCSNGATNYPYCNNNVTYVWCNGVQYTAPYTCPVLNVTANIDINPKYITAGNAATLSWRSTNASSCVISGNGVNYYTTQGNNVMYPTQSGTYTITCQGVNGSTNNTVTDSTYITVTQPVQTCNNSATNYPYCNNNVTYVWCNGVQYTAPYTCPAIQPAPQYVTVITNGSNPSQNSATISGFINANNTSAQAWFEYGTNVNYLSSRTSAQSTYSSGQINSTLTNLTCNTRYYYRAAASNNAGTQYGQTLSFVTSACPVVYAPVYQAPVYQPAPPVYQPVYQAPVYQTYGYTITRSATSVGYTQAQLNGTWVNGNTGNGVGQAYFQYGTNYRLVNRTGSQAIHGNSASNYFSQALYTLQPGTRYYYRAVVTGINGTKYGQIMSFVTPSYSKKKVSYIYLAQPVTAVVKRVTVQSACNCENAIIKTENTDTNTTVNSNTTNSAINAIAQGSHYMDLVVEKMESEAVAGKSASYRVIYKNTSNVSVQDVSIRIVLGDEMTMRLSERGEYDKNGQTLVYNINNLKALEEGRFTFTTNVKANSKLGDQSIINGYANYTIPSLVQNGQAVRDEVTNYTTSIIGNGQNVMPVESMANGKTVTTNGNFLPKTLTEWLLLFVILFIFLGALRYLFLAFKRGQMTN